MASPYERVLAKYDWAKKHIDNFEAAVESFRGDNPHTISRKQDGQTGEVVFYVTSVPVVPEWLSFMLGDALHNLRSTLDHLAWGLVETSPGGRPNSQTAFPIFDTPEDYTSGVARRVPCLRQPCYDILNRIQPYKGGGGNSLWQLHKLDIVNKHRMLLAIASVNVAHSMTPSEKAKFEAIKASVGPISASWAKYTNVGFVRGHIALEAGHEIGRFAASDVDDEMRFAFDVAINEPDILEPTPTFLLLRDVASQILRVIENFAPCL